MFSRWLIGAIACVGLSVHSCAASAQGALESTGLGDIDPWGVGRLSRAEGALPVTLWQGSSVDSLMPLLGRLGVYQLSPTTRDLLQRVLLSPGRAPAGEDSDRLLAQRMRLIWDLGKLEAYAELARNMPDAEGIKSSTEAMVELQFVRGNEASACSVVRSSIEVSPYLFQARAVCFALEGNFASANLAIELGLEQDAHDPWIQTAINALETMPEDDEARAEAELPEANFKSGLTTALSFAGEFPLPESVYSAVNPGFAREISLRTDIERPMRIGMARRAAFNGLMIADELREAYRRDPEPEPEVEDVSESEDEDVEDAAEADAEAQSEEDETDLDGEDWADPLDRALYVLEDETTSEENKVASIRRALIWARSEPERFAILAGVLRPYIAEINDFEAIGANAEFFAIAMLAAGDQGQANRFQRMASVEGGPEEDAFLQAWLDGVRVVSGADRSSASPRVVSRRLADTADEATQSQTARMLHHFLVFDGALAPEAVEFLSGDAGDTLSSGTELSVKDQILVRSNLNSGSVGEALLRIVSALGRDPDRTQSADLAEILELLSTHGYEPEARRLALEALNYQRVGD
ncbi:MAG: hypothetical protein CMK09_01500 [Ponticaulis sp.]|nr:hypothetical protein [Ponticaulis sp.]|tara:strand:+ start:24529 stop:26277 length:1749 start_codon:yes stop_codon:yes gene_type:complete